MSRRTPPHPTWTYEDYAALPDDGNKYEVLDGEVLVTPSPSTRHQHILFMLSIQLYEYVNRYELGVVLPDIDLLFQPGQFLRPDLLFVPTSAREGIAHRGIELTPGLVVEVLSPSSSSNDRVKKPRRYGDFGVPEYWVVDPEDEMVWVWRFAKGRMEGERVEQLTWQPDASVPPFVLDREKLFRPL
jgi:Uma2 family endonuclease